MAITRFNDGQKAIFEEVSSRILEVIRERIQDNNRVVEGDLVDSFDYDIKPDFIRIYSRARYASAVDVGYNTKTTKPGKGDLRLALADWILAKGISVRAPRGGNGRFQNRTASNIMRAAGAMAQKIHRGGYGEQYGFAYFTEYAFETLDSYITSELGDSYLYALQSMVEENIRKMVKGTDIYD